MKLKVVKLKVLMLVNMSSDGENCCVKYGDLLYIHAAGYVYNTYVRIYIITE